jgi:eukaryotic-like serine/threonine-protein kinase
MDEIERLKQRIGVTLAGKWTLERLLGYGGMAAVYVGVHKIGRRAAIKILHPDIAENKQIARRFEQEAHAVNRFTHPGAVAILDVDVSEDGAPFLVMELLDGEPLSARVERAAIDVAEVVRLADELLDVLAAAHASGIIHRDIKPDNLFVLRNGQLKVLDFGIAQMRAGAPKSMYTALGTTIGTLTYMSPEQVAGREIDGRADLFAVGCTMFRILSGRSPHQGETDLELMVKMAMEPAPPLASVAPHVPRDICLVVDRALAFDRDRRYPDARTMQEDVRALMQGRPPPFASSRFTAGDLPNPQKLDAAAAALTFAGPIPGLSGASPLPGTSAEHKSIATAPTLYAHPGHAGVPAAGHTGSHGAGYAGSAAATPPPAVGPQNSPSGSAMYGGYGAPSAVHGIAKASYGAVSAPQSAAAMGYGAAPAGYGGASAYGSVGAYGGPAAGYGHPEAARGSMANAPAPMTPPPALLASTAPMEPFGGLGAVTRMGGHPTRNDNKNDKKNETWIALAAIGAMFVVLGIAIAVWLGRRGADGDAAVATDGPAMDEAAGTSKSSSTSKPKGGKGSKKPSPRGSPTVIEIRIGPNGEPMPGHYQGDSEAE